MFGACLMGNAQLVADCIESDARCGVDSGDGETRIGIDDQDDYEFLCDFINTVSGKGECEMFIIHARKAAFWVKSKTVDPAARLSACVSTEA